MANNSIKSILLDSIASSILGVNYQAINENGTEGACFMIRIINNSTKDVTISFDGVNDHEFVPLGTIAQIEVQTNAQPTNSTALFNKGLIVYAKGTAGTGNVYLTGYYQERS